ncbi:lysophospholipid acyltransferase family protein [bacterium]|nr:lysophospholipid acyltransferase family protein [bacterium]
MATVSHRVEYLLARTGLGLANLLPAPLADQVGAGLGRLTGTILGSRKRIARDNLQRALGDELTDEQIEAVIGDVFANIGRTLFELARFKRLTPAVIDRMIVSSGMDGIDAALAAGRGALVVVPHFGNWELGGAFLASKGYPVDMLVTTQHNSLVDELLTSLRQAAGMGIIRVGRSVKNVFKALKQNRVIAIAADQHAPAAELVTDFFGRPAAAARGPALFAIRSGAPILPFCIRRERFDRHVIMPGPAVLTPDGVDEETAIRQMTEEYLAFFEKCIREYPAQWMWTHRRWKLD